MNSQKMIRLSVIAALAGVYGSAFAGTTYYKVKVPTLSTRRTKTSLGRNLVNTTAR